jgi:hypothetical protein
MTGCLLSFDAMTASELPPSALPTVQPSESLPSSAIDAATAHLRDVLAIALEHGPERRALVVFDRRTGLSRALLDAYRRNLPDAASIRPFNARPTPRK